MTKVLNVYQVLLTGQFPGLGSRPTLDTLIAMLGRPQYLGSLSGGNPQQEALFGPYEFWFSPDEKRAICCAVSFELFDWESVCLPFPKMNLEHDVIIPRMIRDGVEIAVHGIMSKYGTPVYVTSNSLELTFRSTSELKRAVINCKNPQSIQEDQSLRWLDELIPFSDMNNEEMYDDDEE